MFEKEIQTIEFRKKELENKIKEQKQYDNLDFTADSLLMLKDKQVIDTLVNPSNITTNLIDYLMNSKEVKQKLISKYIDSIEIERKGYEINIKNIKLRESFIEEELINNAKYNTPSEFLLFNLEERNIFMNREIKTSKETHKYFENFKVFINQYSDLEFNYYETYYDFNNISDSCSFEVNNDNEILYRIIFLKDDKKLKKGEDKIKLGLITINTNSLAGKYSKKYFEYLTDVNSNIIKSFRANELMKV